MRTRIATIGLAAWLLVGLVVSTAAQAQGARDRLVCSPATNGGHLINGVCILPAATEGEDYLGFILTSNNSGGTFAVVSGALPPGLSMPSSYGASGTIVAGIPTQQGTFTFTVRGTDQQGQSLHQTYGIRVEPPAPLVITFPSVCCPAGSVGGLYLQNFFLSGGLGPYAWSIAAGQLPPGLSFAPSPPASISGTPSKAGSYGFTVRVTDSTGAHAEMDGTIVIS